MLWFKKAPLQSSNVTNSELTLKFQALLNNSEDLAIFLDENNKVTEINKALEKIFGYKTADFLGKPIKSLPFWETGSIRNRDFLHKLEKREAVSSELDLADKYKNKVKLAARNVFFDGKEHHLLIFKEIIKQSSDFGEEENGLNFLSQVSLKLSEYLTEQEIYQYIADQLAFLAKNSYIMVSRQDVKDHIEVVASANSNKLLQIGLEKIKNPVGMTFDLNEAAQIVLPRGKVVELTGGFYTLTFGTMPKALCFAAEKTLRIKKFYSAGFYFKDQLFGNVAIVTQEKELKNQKLIETFVNLASVALHRRKTEEKWENLVTQLDQEKRHVQEEKDKINTILYSIGDGVFVVDKDFKITLFNGAAEKISGFKADEVIGKKFSEVLVLLDEKEKKPSDQFIYDCMKTGKVMRMGKNTILTRSDKTFLPVDDSAAPLKDDRNNVIGCVVVFRDVTEERKIDQAKSEFVSLASHQLRTPLAAINWYTEMLLAKDAGEINEKQKDFLGEIYTSSQRMVDLVKSLLNVSRLELGTFIVEPEDISFKELIVSVIDEMKPKIIEKELKIEQNYEETGKISADPKLTRIVFQNLISNSVKYTNNKGTINISITKEAPNLKLGDNYHKGSILVTVKDNGLGIPKAQQSQIFSKLFRADNVKPKEVEGTGLGLYIAKSIIDHSGGQIWFESAENKGTTFFVRLPLIGMQKKSGTKTLG